MAGRAPFDQPDIYQPRIDITPETRLFTAGSCFAQHVTRYLKRAGMQVIDEEPAPDGLPDAVASKYGFGLYAARFGNIYTMRQFRQLLDELSFDFEPSDIIWERDGRFYDALRPGVEPSGLEHPDHVREMRQAHLDATANAVSKADVVIFTMGLTESWEHIESGTVYPTAPGTIAGAYDPDIYQFVNFGVLDILEDFNAANEALRKINPDIKWILSVSPVPLTATATQDHVLSATMRSKSVLRAACDEICGLFDNVDYFPAYELVLNPASRGMNFADDLRNPTEETVANVMRVFFEAHQIDLTVSQIEEPSEFNPHCEDVLLEAFQD